MQDHFTLLQHVATTSCILVIVEGDRLSHSDPWYIPLLLFLYSSTVINVNGLVFSTKAEKMNSFLFGPMPFTKTRVVSRCGHGGLHPYAIVGNQLLPLLSTSVTLTCSNQQVQNGIKLQVLQHLLHRVCGVSPISGHDEEPVILSIEKRMHSL